MKKLFCILLAAAALLSLCACGRSADQGEPVTLRDPEGENVPAHMLSAEMVGGWTPSESPEVTEERLAVFNKAMEGLVGVNYTPVAYLGSQVVAGSNHAFLCQATAVVPDAKPYYAMVYVYEALDGSCRILSIAEFDVGSLCSYGG